MPRFAMMCVVLLSSLSVCAAGQSGVNLLRPDSLAGWDYGDVPIKGWKIYDGKLTGEKGATPLLAGWTQGDFDLQFNWTVSSDGELVLALRDVPRGAGLMWLLSEGARGGKLTDNQRVALAGAQIQRPASGVHTAQISRAGDRLSLKIDARPAGEIKIEPARRFGMMLSVPEGSATIGDVRLAETPGEPIFNGHDLSGWWTPGKLAGWRVDDGQIVCLNQGGNYLRSDKEYGNFTLSLEYNMARGGNSGVGIRTAREGWPSGDGMELQLYDHPGLDKQSTMAIYGNLEPFARADRSEEWNSVVIKAEGRLITAWVNGELMQSANTGRLPELKHRHLRGWIGLQDHGDRIRFRNLRVREAPDGLGLDAWYASRAETGPQVVLDRILNTERLAVNDHISSGVTQTSISKPGETMLVDLTGPGAIVRVWNSGASGQLKFYFDGEQKPRIECPAEALFEHVPQVCEEHSPLLTCIGFSKKLKVVLDASGPAEFRLDHVNFPADLPVESYSGSSGSLPRGLLSTLDYRHHQVSNGTHREADPYPRISGPIKTIGAGSSEKLLSLDGAGTVLWFKLLSEMRVLESNELWLDVYVDGESSPAVSAPARFLFPALHKGENHSSFVMLNRAGLTSMLAMPFGRGLSIVARNAGKEPIKEISAVVSVDRTAEGKSQVEVPPGRLRGVFQPAGSGPELLRYEGRGRWVALVLEPQDVNDDGSKHIPFRFATVEIDGQPRSSWAGTSLEAFLGASTNQDVFTALSGHSGALAWRYMLLEPVDFDRSLVIKANQAKPGARLALFYTHN